MLKIITTLIIGLLLPLNAVAKDCYIKSDSNSQNVERCLNEAEKGNAEAQHTLALMFGSGIGAAKDLSKSLFWNKKAANQGHVISQYILALIYDDEGELQDYGLALKWMTKAASQGHLESQYLLGARYYNGRGVPQDYKQALKWYSKAAIKGHLEAQYNLGTHYYQGKGFPQDDKQALRWLTKAANQGHPKAQYNLGIMYFKGRGVPQDYVMTYMWMNLAATTKDAMAIKFRNNILKKMSSSQIEDGQRLSREWFSKNR